MYACACIIISDLIRGITCMPSLPWLNMASKLESVEYKTIIGCTKTLTTAFKSSTISIANELLSNGLIPPEVHNKITGMASGLSDDVKATNMVNCVADQVRICPGKYYDFMGLPLFKEQWLSSLHDAIITEYGKIILCTFISGY